MAIIEMKVPELAESITEVTLAQFLISDGDVVEMDQPICEMETDKASQELFAEKSGKVTFVAEEGADLAIGALICTIDTSVAPAPKTEAPAAAPKPAPQEKAAPIEEAKKEKSYAKGHASPAASKMIAENNLDASSIQGSGPGGRITKADILKAFAEGSATIQQGAEAMVSQSKAFARTESEAKMSRLRRTISERLVFAKNSTAMLTTFNEVDMKPVMDLRRKHKEKFKEAHGVNLGFMSFFAKAVCHALQQFPTVNAYIDPEKSLITYHDYCDISIAVSTPKGLVVPVIRNAESLSMWEIEKEVKRLALAGRDGKLSMEDMEGGTFSITNGGVFGSLMSTPILNPPQSAILGMHKIEERPVAIDGKVEIRPMMYLALSYDHRIIDGKESVSFLVAVKDMLENPEKLLLGTDPVDLLLGM
ncbi:MAG TPA: dihydrolipoyllysine-residue succinyltransferase [Bacteroidetes bacterium]|nr:dihydrolipoyllysine-residue succinyltransferase [Bacteroidota bacterium]